MQRSDERVLGCVSDECRPIGSSTLAYGSCDGGQTVHTDIAELNEKMEAVRLFGVRDDGDSWW
jgi:hypothetical protein